MHEEERKTVIAQADRKLKESKQYPDYLKLIKDFKNLTDNEKYKFKENTLILKPIYLEHIGEFIGNDTKELDFFIYVCCITCKFNDYLKNADRYHIIWKIFEQNIFS